MDGCRPAIEYLNPTEYELVWFYQSAETKTVRVYINGIRLSESDYNLKYNKGQIFVVFKEPVDGSLEIEVI
jgi:hypothetical protein